MKSDRSDQTMKRSAAGMKKTGRTIGGIIGGIVLTFAIGGGLIFGNAALAVQTMAAEPRAALTARTVATEPGAALTVQTMATELNAGDPAGVATILKTLENGTTVMVEYYYDEGGAKAAVTHKYTDGQTSVSNYEGATAEAAIERFGGPKRNIPDRYVKARPGESNVEEIVAINSAIAAIAEKYALKQETLDKFSVTPVFYSRYEDIASSVWWISLYPANPEDFSDIGCYTAILNGDTGETISLLSAVDGKG
jgi:hypothetical protein